MLAKINGCSVQRVLVLYIRKINSNSVLIIHHLDDESVQEGFSSYPERGGTSKLEIPVDVRFLDELQNDLWL